MVVMARSAQPPLLSYWVISFVIKGSSFTVDMFGVKFWLHHTLLNLGLAIYTGVIQHNILERGDLRSSDIIDTQGLAYKKTSVHITCHFIHVFNKCILSAYQVCASPCVQWCTKINPRESLSCGNRYPRGEERSEEMTILAQGEECSERGSQKLIDHKGRFPDPGRQSLKEIKQEGGGLGKEGEELGSGQVGLD